VPAIGQNTERKRFADVASHDIQEPLRMLTNFAERLVREYPGVLAEAGQEYLEIIGDSARRMHDMVKDLPDYARLDRYHRFQ
jgi:light-regulated signal transduction histidine kinase (bacteriophytochrome)